MKPVDIRLIILSVVLILEIVLIMVNIPVLSLVGGIVLLGLVLFFLGRMLSAKKTGERAIHETEPKKPAVATTPASSAPTADGKKTPPLAIAPEKKGIFPSAGGKIRTLFSRRSRKKTKETPPAGKPAAEPVKAVPKPAAETKATSGTASKDKGTSAARASRFETFTAIGKGLKLLFARSPKEGKGMPAGAETSVGARKGQEAPESLKSITADAVSPVGTKREPSPFSSLGQNMVLDADLIPASRQGTGKDSGAGEIFSDGDLDSLEIFPHDGDISRMDLTLDDEAGQITIDEEQDDEVAQILEAHHEELKTVSPDGAPDDSLAGTDNMDLDGAFDSIDLGDFNPEGGMAEPARSIITAPAEVTPAMKTPAPARGAPGLSSKSSMERDVADENMLSFSSGSGKGDDDLISSLKTDISGTKRRINESLVRDLKDTKVQSSDIEKEITDLQQLLARPKKR